MCQIPVGCHVCFGSLAVVHDSTTRMAAIERKADVTNLLLRPNREGLALDQD